MIFRRAIEWAFESAQQPVVRLSPWPYQYDAAFMVRHDLENYVSEIAERQRVGPVRGELRRQRRLLLLHGGDHQRGYDNYTDHRCRLAAGSALTARPSAPTTAGCQIQTSAPTPTPMLSRLTTIINIFTGGRTKLWTCQSATLTPQTPWPFPSLKSKPGSPITRPPDPRAWVAPYFNATREDCYPIQEQLNVKITGEQKLAPFPQLDPLNANRRQAIFLPERAGQRLVCRPQVAQVLGPWQGSSTGNGLHDHQHHASWRGLLLH